MKYKLLVLDVDGTLLDSEKKISKRTLAALLKVQQMGVRIVLASGRPTYGLMPIAKALELGNYGGFILSYNGGQIINAQSGELLFERRINPEMLPYLEKKSRKNGFAIFTYHEDTIRKRAHTSRSRAEWPEDNCRNRIFDSGGLCPLQVHAGKR